MDDIKTKRAKLKEKIVESIKEEVSQSRRKGKARHPRTNALKSKKPRRMTAVLPECINDQDRFLVEVITQVAYDVDILRNCLTKKDEDTSMVASRRVKAIQTMTELHKQLMELRGGHGAVTKKSAVKDILSMLQEVAGQLLSDDQYNLLLDALHKKLDTE